MSVPQGMFLSLAVVSMGFSLLRLSLRDGWAAVFGQPDTYGRKFSRVTAISLLLLSPYPWLAVAAGSVVGWMSWFFCIVPLGGILLIGLWPFSRTSALVAPPVAFALLTAVSGI